MTDEAVDVSRNGAILEVRLNRPKANAIDAHTSRRLGQVFAQFRDDPNYRVAIITGGGERFFSAGWDLKAAAAGESATADFGPGGFGGLQELPNLNKPVIAAVNGIACGGGFELAISADLILAAQSARFALPEINVGILADAATIKLARRIPYHVAMDMLLTGRWIEADEAQRWGLVNQVVEDAQLMPRARELATMLSEGPPLVFAAIKEVLRETENLTVQSAFDRINNRSLGTVKALYSSEDMLEGATAFAEKRPPRWRGR